MKLCLNSHKLACDCSVEQIVALCEKNGLAGVEFSVGYGHRHGVELDASDETLLHVRDELYRHGLETVSIATYCRFDRPDAALEAQNFQNARRGIDMAARMGCGIFRFVANDLPDFMPRDAFVGKLAGIMAQLADYAAPKGVNVLLNMHGTFFHRCDNARTVELAARPNAGLVYNCDLKDLAGSSAQAALERVGPYIRHVHLHDLLLPYPYRELFAYLKKTGYTGWYSVVVDEPSAQPDRFLGYYAALARAWEALA